MTAAAAAQEATLTVSELQAKVSSAVATAVPGPIWVRGEISNLRRTAGGALFFRLVDPESVQNVIEIAVRGRVMFDVDRMLDAAGVGALRDGVEVRVRGVVGFEASRSLVRLTLLTVDPEFIAGRLAMDRRHVLARLRADGTLSVNGRLDTPLVPLQVGLVTSRGSAAHADFVEHLRRSPYRFRVRTVHASMQGDASGPAIVRALDRLGREEVDVVVLVRGGGARLDLAAFDSEEVARAIARMPVPVITGIGHEVDRTVADEAAGVAVKTPTAAAEWLVGAVADYARRIDTARRLIAEEARAVCSRAEREIDHVAAVLGSVRGTLAHHRDRLQELGRGIADEARRAVGLQRELLAHIGEAMDTLGVEPTLRRGFALVEDESRAVVRSVDRLTPGDRLSVRLADGIVAVRVEQIDG